MRGHRRHGIIFRILRALRVLCGRERTFIERETMTGMREKIIREVQRRADTKTQRIDAAIVSRVASITLDVVIAMIARKRGK